MITNWDTENVQERVKTLVSSDDLYGKVLETVRQHPEPFRIDTGTTGLDFVGENNVKGKPNRGRMKLFASDGGRMAVFFYKRSVVPHSFDRFSYGGRVFTPRRITNEEIAEWLDFVLSGLDPRHRPESLIRAFDYDVPD